MKWYKQKTTWAGLASVLSGVGGLVTGSVDPNTAVPLIATGLIGIFLRQGIAKGQ